MAVFSAIIRHLNQRGLDPSPYQRADCSSAKKPSPEVNRRGGAYFAFLPRFLLLLAFRERAVEFRGGIFEGPCVAPP